jgi:hypothetical protein
MGIRMENSFLLEQIPKTIAPELSSLVDDVVAIIFKDNPSRFLKAHYVSVDGTEQPVLGFEFDALAFGIVFDTEYRVALRAMGTESPGSINVGHMSQPR